MAKSTKNKFLSFLNLLILFALFCSLNGCGNKGDTPATGTTNTASLTLSVPSSVTFGTPVTATATLKDANGAAVSNAVVMFAAADTTLVTFTPAYAKAFTNSGGVASITLNAASIDSANITSITASASITAAGTTATITSAPAWIEVKGGTVTLGVLTLGTSSISAYGTSSVSVPVLVNGSAASMPITVTFTSSACGTPLTSPVTTVAGVAISTYKDNGCASGTSSITDTITASVTEGAHSSTNITILPTTANNIQFVSAIPSIIGTQGGISTPTLPQSSTVKFKVVDENGYDKSGVLVDFSLLPLTIVGNVTLSYTQAYSSSDGTVTVTVYSGAMPTPVWVVATIDGSSPAIKSQSNTLTITTGLPSQDAFSLSYTPFNIEGLLYDGTTSQLSIIASDRLGNPVPDGTAVNFVVPENESGQINPASCTTASGTCTVTYKSSGTRPADGRATILAYTVGEKSFIDANGNNMYDAGETFYDLGSMYVDANENGSYDTVGDQLLAPYSSEGTYDCLTQPGGTALPAAYGIYGNIPSVAGTCNKTWGPTYVRRSAVIVLSDSFAQILPATLIMGSSCTGELDLPLMDKNNNPMPAGTTVSIVNNNVTYVPNGATASSPATVSITAGTPVLNAIYPTSISLMVTADCSAGVPTNYPSGTVTIVVTTPKGNITNIPVTVN